MDGTRSSGRRAIALAVLAVGVAAGALAAYVGYRCVIGRGERASAEADGSLSVKHLLTDAEAARVRELVTAMLSAAGSAEAAAQLRDHIESLIKQESPSAAPTMVFAVDCLATRFGSLDMQTRQLSLVLVSEILGWFGQNATSCWGALLAPSKSVLSAALEDPTADVTLAALKIIESSWEWSPEGADGPAQRKSLGMWKAELHERCVELLPSCNAKNCRLKHRHHDDRIRAAAAAAVVSVPIDSAAAKALVLLSDSSAFMRRSVLRALSDRPELFASDDVLPFLNDPDPAVRNTADIVLTCRGLSREHIALAVRATNASELVRAQAPRYIVESTAVDRAVWLGQLSRDEAAAVRTEAARALATVGGDECLTRLAEMAESDPNEPVRRLAGDLLRQLPPSARSANRAAAHSEPETLPTLQAPTAN